ncbi:unnamed protein product [Dovyalis caffra]|uniref:Uncharacterized protein n=1 Tax=Dovyalis caffra TaxID=77055 RepID=A0AAV1RT38_9ROSI|nr:unnamed protein product [Dovyalis caffra]
MVRNEVRNITHSVDGKSVSEVYRVTIYWINAEPFVYGEHRLSNFFNHGAFKLVLWLLSSS